MFQKPLLRIFSFIIFLLVSLYFLAMIYTTISQRSVIYRYLNEALNVASSQLIHISWKKPTQPQGLKRPFTPNDEEMLSKALSEAWNGFALAQDIKRSDFLADYFSSIALRRAKTALSDATQSDTKMVVLALEGEPVFYHLDGSVLQFRMDMLNVRFASKDNALVHFQIGWDKAMTTLMNESSGWRVFVHERYGFTPIKPAKASYNGHALAGINYYPKATPWRKFWAEFDPEIIERDFQKIIDLNANAVRIFLPSADFQTLTDFNENLDNLRILLDLASQKGIAVIPTLFDLKSNYQLNTWSGDYKYLISVLSVLKNHHAVAMVDIKNEPDLDFNHHGRSQVMAWLKAMIFIHRYIAPDLPVTIGWSSSDFAIFLRDHLDVITYHDYEPILGATSRLAEVQSKVGNMPVLVTEIGSTAFSFLAGWPSSPKKQADQLARRIRSLVQADGIFVWTLYDFPTPDPIAVGNSPWVKKLQANFGLITSLDKLKPSAHSIKQEFHNFLKEK